jgi:hypothetical protein
MSWLKTMVAELIGLFIDDVIFALAIVLWIGMMWLLPPYLGLQAPWNSVVFFAGLVLILCDSAARHANKKL